MKSNAGNLSPGAGHEYLPLSLAKARKATLGSILSFSFHLLLAACLLTSCSPGAVPAETSEITPSPLAPAGQGAVLDQAASTSTATPTPTIFVPRETLAPLATATRGAYAPSGWSIFSNPDYVQGIAVHENHLWAATLGGVVDWNLDTQTPVIYTPREGLVEIQGNDVTICAAPEKTVIVAHEAGILSAYNLTLKKWSQIPITFQDGTTLEGVSALRCDEKNRRLLAGAAGGLGILDLKTMRWERIGAENGLQVDTILSIDVVGQSIWVAAGKQSAFLIMGKSVFPFNGASGFPSGPVNDLSVAPDSTIWFAYPTGLVRYKEKRWYSYGSQSLSGAIPFVSVDKVQVGQQNVIWIASANEGVCPFDRVTHVCPAIYPAPQNSPVTDLVAGDDGVAYASTNGGGILVLRKDQRETLLVGQQNLVSNHILGISGGRDGTVYIATEHGVNYLEPGRPFEPWGKILPRSIGLSFSKVSGVFPFSTGTWYISADEPRASLQSENGWLTLDANKGLSGRVFDLAMDQRGYVWFATDHGIDIWDGVTMRSYGPNTGLPGTAFHTLYAEKETMWAGTDQGLLRYERYQWSAVLSGISIKDIAQDKRGGLLLGTDQGLLLFDGSQSYQWLVNLNGKLHRDLQVTALSVDKRGDLWVGTAHDGLFHYDYQAWEQFDTARGMPTNSIRAIFTDQLGAVWVASTTGQGGGALVRFMP